MILFVLNHYPEAARFVVEFPRDKVTRFENLAGGAVVSVQDGAVTLDVDRKSAELYRVI